MAATAPLVEDLVLGRNSRAPDVPAAGSSADMAIDVDDFESPPPLRPPRRGRRRPLTPPLSNIPRQPIVLDDSDDDDDDVSGPFDPEAAHDEIMFGAGPGPSTRAHRRRPHRRALFSPPPPPPQAAGPPPPVPGIPDRLRHLRLSLHNLFMNPFEGAAQHAVGLGAALFHHGPPLQPPPQAQAAAAHRGLGLGGFILRQAQQNVGRGVGGGNGRNIRFTFDFGMPGLGLDADGWQRYDEDIFEQLNQPAAPPFPQYKREFLFKTPVPAGFTSDFAEPEPPEPPKVFDVETGEEVIDKGKRKAEPAQRLLVCAKCVDPLRADQNARAARVWALRCGHVVDGKCLAALAEDVQLLHSHSHSHDGDEQRPSAPARRPTRRAKPKAKRGRKPPAEPEVEVLAEREWACPVPRCGKAHWSQLVRKGEPGAAPVWVQKAGCGAIQVFV